MGMGTKIISGSRGTIIVPGLAGEVVDAIYWQWAVNGHNIPAAFATVAEHHTDPAVRHAAATTPLIPALTGVLEPLFWQQARDERQALRA